MRNIVCTYIKCLFVAVTMLITNLLSAQSNAHLDRTKIQIGDHITYTFTIPMAQAAGVRTLETIPDTLEIISSSFDTLNQGGKTLISFKYVFTSFVEGNHIVDADGKALQFTVVPMKIDTTKTVIKDIHPQATESFSISEIMPILIWVIAAVALLVAFIIGRKIYRKYHIKDIKKIFVKPKPKEPADIIALRRLEHLRLERLWESGRVKEYYSELTDALREYLENRYSIPAIEMTSNEIMLSLHKQKDVSAESNELMKEILKNGDLVKFAKMLPDSFMCERCMQDALNFINNTKFVPLSPEEEKTRQQQEKEDSNV